MPHTPTEPAPTPAPTIDAIPRTSGGQARQSLVKIIKRDSLRGGEVHSNTQSIFISIGESIRKGEIPVTAVENINRALEHTVVYTGFYHSLHQKIQAESLRSKKEKGIPVSLTEEVAGHGDSKKLLNEADFFATYGAGALYLLYTTNTNFRRNVDRGASPNVLAAEIDRLFVEAQERTKTTSGAFVKKEMPLMTKEVAAATPSAAVDTLVSRFDILDITSLLVAKAYNSTSTESVNRIANAAREAAYLASPEDGHFDYMFGINRQIAEGKVAPHQPITKAGGLMYGASNVKKESMRKIDIKILKSENIISRNAHRVEKAIKFVAWTWGEWNVMLFVAVSNKKMVNQVEKLTKKINAFDPNNDDNLAFTNAAKKIKSAADNTYYGRKEYQRAIEGIWTDQSNGFAIMGTHFAVREAAKALNRHIKKEYKNPVVNKKNTQAMVVAERNRFLLDVQERTAQLSKVMGEVDDRTTLLGKVADVVDTLIGDHSNTLRRGHGFIAYVRSFNLGDQILEKLDNVIGFSATNPRLEDLLKDSSRFAEVIEVMSGVISSYFDLLRQSNGGISLADEGLTPERIMKVARTYADMNNLERDKAIIASSAKEIWDLNEAEEAAAERDRRGTAAPVTATVTATPGIDTATGTAPEAERETVVQRVVAIIKSGISRGIPAMVKLLRGEGISMEIINDAIARLTPPPTAAPAGA